MVNFNLGSIAAQLHDIVPNIPTAISGGTLMDMVDRRRLFVEDYTGLTVGSVEITTTYQPVLFNLTAADLLRMVHLRGGDMSMGDIRVGRSALDSADRFEALGMRELQILGKRSRFYKALG